MWTPTTRKQYIRETSRYQTDVTDEEWLVIMPHLPSANSTGRPRAWPMREPMCARGRCWQSDSSGAIYFSANQSFATKVSLHQREVKPTGLVRELGLPPGCAFGSPVKTKQFSFVKLVS